jgi:hypothetical protein
MGKPKNYCDLCHVKNKAWTHGKFFGIASCKNHFGQPLIVLAEHKAELTEEEKEELLYVEQKYLKNYRKREKEEQDEKQHWHQHYFR